MKTNRTWAECQRAWESLKESLRNSDQINQMIYNSICEGHRWPLVGVCLSIEEYERFTREGRNLKEIGGYCESGMQTHEDVRLFKNVGMHELGLTTPRKGYYKVVRINGETMTCYYNHDRGDAFLPEEVEINKKPLFNRASVGPKHTEIRVGDVIRVEDTTLVEQSYNGSTYTSYKVVWGLYNR
jgi:hypothetical protein